MPAYLFRTAAAAAAALLLPASAAQQGTCKSYSGHALLTKAADMVPAVDSGNHYYMTYTGAMDTPVGIGRFRADFGTDIRAIRSEPVYVEFSVEDAPENFQYVFSLYALLPAERSGANHLHQYWLNSNRNCSFDLNAANFNHFSVQRRK